MHALWDSVVFQQLNDMPLPLNENDWQRLGEISLKIRTQHPLHDLRNEVETNHDQWANEGLGIVESYVYREIKENEKPSEVYILKGQEIAERQMVKAGYRLAYLLKKTLNNKDNEDFFKMSSREDKATEEKLLFL